MYIVTNIHGAPVNPYGAGFKKQDTDKASVSILTDEAEAKAFAEFCAKKWKDSVFHVMKSVGSVTTVDPPVAWKGAT